MRRAAAAAACVVAAVATIALLAAGTEVFWEPRAVDPEPPRPPVQVRPPVPAANTLGERAALIETEAECAADGGEWRWVNAFFEACVLPYPDAGMECSASSECVAGCFAADFASLEAGRGTCRANTDHSGCMGEVGGNVIDCLYDDILVSCTRGSTERECDDLH